MRTAKLRVVCFFSAGTTAALYTAKVGFGKNRKPNALMAWADKNDVEVLAVELPAHAKRRKEAPVKCLRGGLGDLVSVLVPRLKNGPYAVVGHCMGTWAGYEFTMECQKQGLHAPVSFVAACFPSPDVPEAERPWAKMQVCRLPSSRKNVAAGA